MMDLVIAMTPYVNEKNIKILYGMAQPWLQVYVYFIMLLDWGGGGGGGKSLNRHVGSCMTTSF